MMLVCSFQIVRSIWLFLCRSWILSEFLSLEQFLLFIIFKTNFQTHVFLSLFSCKVVKNPNPENYLEEFGKMSRTKNKNKNKVNDTKSNSTAKENEQSSQGDDDSKGKYVKANRPLLQLNKGN